MKLSRACGAALLWLLVGTAAAQTSSTDAAVQPSCPGPFGSLGPTCFCTRTRDDTWSITCGCRDFPPAAVVQLTPRLLPTQPPAALTLTVQGCRRAVLLSASFLRAVANVTDLTLDVRDTEEFSWERVSPESDVRPLHGQLTAVSASFENVRLPHIPANFFSQRRLASVEMTGVEVGEILPRAFVSDVAAPRVVIRGSRVDRVRSGAFRFAESGGGPVDLSQPQLLLADVRVREWQTNGCVGGARLVLLRCRVGQLAERALSLTAAGSLVCSSTQVEAAAPAAVQVQGAPPLLLLNNTFHVMPPAPQQAAGSAASLVHFSTGPVPASFRFTNNTVFNSASPPVAPEPQPPQVADTRLQCLCHLLAWLPGSAFEDGATCAPEPAAADEQQSAGSFLAERCRADGSGGPAVGRSGFDVLTGTAFSGRTTVAAEGESAASPVRPLVASLTAAVLLSAALT